VVLLLELVDPIREEATLEALTEETTLAPLGLIRAWL